MEKRSQYLCYELLEKFQLNPVERSILQIVNAKPNYYKSSKEDNCSTLEKIAQLIKRSKRTVQRGIKSLQQKGLINVCYTFYKNLIITLRTLKTQKQICKEGLVVQLVKYIKKQQFTKKKKTESYPHVTPMSHSRDMTPMSHSTSIEESTKSILPNKFNLNGFLGNIIKQEPSKKSLEQIKLDQIKRYKEEYPNVNLI